MTTLRGSCLCGDVAFHVDGPVDFMSHCHCSRCRKLHGAAFATYLVAGEGALRFTRGADRRVRYESSPGAFRSFCGRCGGVLPDEEPWDGSVGIPAGPLDVDPGVRPIGHIFVASKAPWYDLTDDLPRWDAYPDGVGMPALETLPERQAHAGNPRGSCLCGAVAFEVTGKIVRTMNCHCTRCRKARGAAHGSNFFTESVRFTRGEDRLATYKVPEARYFMQIFCTTCGSPMPRVDKDRGFAVVPMGSMDDDPGVHPEAHIFVGSMAPWFTITDGLPQYEEGPPPLT